MELCHFQLKNYIDKKQSLTNNFDIECKNRLSNLLNQLDKIYFVKNIIKHCTLLLKFHIIEMYQNKTQKTGKYHEKLIFKI